jgi:hypothetical protein
VLVERPWNTIKYGHDYLHAYASVTDAKAKLVIYLDIATAVGRTLHFTERLRIRCTSIRCRLPWRLNPQN